MYICKVLVFKIVEFVIEPVIFLKQLKLERPRLLENFPRKYKTCFMRSSHHLKVKRTHNGIYFFRMLEYVIKNYCKKHTHTHTARIRRKIIRSYNIFLYAIIHFQNQNSSNFSINS